METTPIQIDARCEKRARRVAALLAQCALSHWLHVLDEWICEYEILDQLVDDERDGPRAAVIGLLRSMASVSARPTDREFAALLSELEFLRYRVLRTPNGERPSMAIAETWNPRHCTLKEFIDAGHTVAGYRSAIPHFAPESTARGLLRALNGRRPHPPPRT